MLKIVLFCESFSPKSDSKYIQISSTLLNIQDDLGNALV